VGDTTPAIGQRLRESSAFGLDVTYIRQEAPLGLVLAMLITREHLGGDDFAMYLGDNFIVDVITDSDDG
jgi:glucose-1-phosphate thymidylyltransferase